MRGIRHRGGQTRWPLAISALAGALVMLAAAAGPAEAVTNTTPPSIQPAAEPKREGQTLTAFDGDWQATPEPEIVTRAWRRCSPDLAVCGDVGSGQTYTLTSADVGGRIVLRVTACDSVDCVSLEAATGVVSFDPSNDVLPGISGILRDGETLAIQPGSNIWSGTGTITLAYQWQRCGTACADVAGATGPSYPLTPADVGSRMRVLVSGDSSGGPSTPPPAVSAATDLVAAAPPQLAVRPAIGGTPREGAYLGLYPGEWTGTPPLDLSAQWQRCPGAAGACDDIPGATGPSHKLTARDVGTRLRVVITADNAAPGVETAASALGVLIKSASGEEPRMLSPFPRVAFGGVLTRGGARLAVVRVRGPLDARVTIRCEGPTCPFRRFRRRLNRRVLNVEQLQRRLRAGTVIEILVTKPDEIGKYTRFTIRRGELPARRDACVHPGATTPRRCP